MSVTNNIYRIVMLACTAVVLVAPSSVRSETAGESLADLRLADQHGNVHAIPPATTTVLFAADMAAKKIVQALLDARDTDYLSYHQAVFIADIHGMPRIITKLFALPRMRKYGYEILLVEDADVGERFPRRAGEVTVLGLRDLRPIAIHYVRDVEALTRALEGGLASSPLLAPLEGGQLSSSRRDPLARISHQVHVARASSVRQIGPHGARSDAGGLNSPERGASTARDGVRLTLAAGTW